MNKSKTYSIITRGITKSKKNHLKRVANQNRTSVNSIMLYAIDEYLDNHSVTSNNIDAIMDISKQNLVTN